MFDQFTKARLKITLFISIIATIILSTFAGTVYYFYKQQLVYEISDKLKSTAFEIARELESSHTSVFFDKNIQIPNDIYVCVYNYSTGMIYYKNKFCNFNGNFTGFKVFDKDVVFSTVITKNLDQYHIFVGKDLSKTLQNMYKLKLILFYTFFGISSFILILSFYLSKYILKPIQESMKKQEEFIQNASHDLKTPLSIISSNFQLIKLKNFKNIERNLQAMEKNIDYMKRMIEDLLFISSMEEDKKENINLKKLLEEIIQDFEPKIKNKNINLTVEIKDEFYINASHKDVKRMISNLIENAIKYNINNGEIIINFANKTLTIKNTGQILSEQQIKRIFDRFYRTDESRSTQGTGLGLAIVKEIAKKYGFKVKVYTENKYNVFEVRFK